MKREGILKILWSYYGNGSVFRKGQEEAILAVLEKKKVLVVQKTGWGKSLVYFLTTKILRERGEGVTIVISPLLSLMKNQIDAAKRLNLSSESINSSNSEEWEEIIEKLFNNKVDILFISPERLGNKDFIDKVLLAVKNKIGLFVVDEAHCISDWGHDFRPDYRRIVKIIKMLPMNIPLIATTATANNRVIFDIKSQIGADIEIVRGELIRESIAIDIIKLNKQEERLAWIAENLKNIEGTGIIYALTVDDTKLINSYLRSKGYKSEYYHGGLTGKERLYRENKLFNNEIKVLVATVALGMGYDKGDISFVIHYQKPGNVIAYYQQIGRAGREINIARAILLCGEEDDKITNYFIETAFPTETEMIRIVNIISENNGICQSDILSFINIRNSRLEKCLKYLEIEGAIFKEKNLYYSTLNKWIPNVNHSNEISKIRKAELKRMNDFINTDSCLMNFLAKELDDNHSKNCGKCKNCIGSTLQHKVDTLLVNDAIKFVKYSHLIIEPRTKWPYGINVDNIGYGKVNIAKENQMNEGIALCNYGDRRLGESVRIGKYIKNEFSKELLEESVELLKVKAKEWNIDTIVYIPSIKRKNLVKDLAYNIARKMNIDFVDAIMKIEDTVEQKTLQNSYYQCKNVIKSFDVATELNNLGNVLIIDDMVDSRWTLTYCSYLLKKYKLANKVYSFVLARTSVNEGGRAVGFK